MDFQGQTVQIRFRIGCDMAVGAVGWHIDNIQFLGIDTDTGIDTAADTDSDTENIVNSEKKSSSGSCNCSIPGISPANSLFKILTNLF